MKNPEYMCICGTKMGNAKVQNPSHGYSTSRRKHKKSDNKILKSKIFPYICSVLQY